MGWGILLSPAFSPSPNFGRGRIGEIGKRLNSERISVVSLPKPVLLPELFRFAALRSWTQSRRKPHLAHFARDQGLRGRKRDWRCQRVSDRDRMSENANCWNSNSFEIGSFRVVHRHVIRCFPLDTHVSACIERPRPGQGDFPSRDRRGLREKCPRASPGRHDPWCLRTVATRLNPTGTEQ